MAGGVKRLEVEAAIGDLQHRTLSGIPGNVAQLIYLASTRDYNTARYYHEGLAFRFTEEIAAEALEACHQESFRQLLSLPLEQLVEQVDSYVGSTQECPAEVLQAWKKLEPYRVTMPLASDPLAAELLISNLRTAVAVLEARQPSGPDR